MGDAEKCPECDGELSYSTNHDAYYCDSCNIWMELKCDSPECTFCNDRPEKPNESKS